MARVVQKGLSDLIQSMSEVGKKTFIDARKAAVRDKKARRGSGTLHSAYTSFNQSADIFSAQQRRLQSAQQRRLQSVDNLFDNPSRVPDQTTMSAVMNSPLLMGLEEGVETATTRANLKPPKPGDEFLPSGHGGALESLGSTDTAPNTPASLLSGAQGPRDSVFGDRPGYNAPAGFGRETAPEGYRGPKPPKPPNATIASMLSDLTPENMARIHRGNVAASHPGLSEEAIDQLVNQGGMRGGIERLGALADDQRAFNEMLQGRSYRELFGDTKNIAKMSDQEKAALQVRHEEMLMDELTHPDAPYLNTYGQEQTQRLVAHNRLMQGDGYSEAAHARANLNTANEAMTEGVTSGTPVANGGTGAFTTTPTQSNNSILGGMDPSTGTGIAMGMGMGALLGGTANYAMGGEFSEGAMMGGLAGGGIMIGARAIGANQDQISNYMQRQVLGEGVYKEGAATANAAAVKNLSSDQVSRLSFGQRQAHGQLMRGADSPRMQARHAVIGGSMLAGVAFTGRRNDKRRGFNAHRGNRI